MNEYVDPLEQVFTDYSNSFHYVDCAGSRFSTKKEAYLSSQGLGESDFSFRCSFPTSLDTGFYARNLRREILDVLSRIQAHFHDRRMVVAYSGGIDSEVILHCAHILGFRPVAIFVNVWNVNSDERRQCLEFCATSGIELREIFLSEHEYLTRWRNLETEICHSINPGAFSSFAMTAVDREREFILYGSSLPQVLWCVDEQRFYHIAKETDRTERQTIASHLGVHAVFPYQFARVWYTLGNHLASADPSLFDLKYRSEIGGKTCHFMRGDIGHSLSRLQKELFYANFPELRERPKMTAHFHIPYIRSRAYAEERTREMVRQWTGEAPGAIAASLRPRHYYNLVRPSPDAWYSGFFWDTVPLVQAR